MTTREPHAEIWPPPQNQHLSNQMDIVYKYFNKQRSIVKDSGLRGTTGAECLCENASRFPRGPALAARRSVAPHQLTEPDCEGN